MSSRLLKKVSSIGREVVADPTVAFCGFPCNLFSAYLLVLENSEAKVTMFLKHVSRWHVSGLRRNASGKGVSFFVLLLSQLPSAVVNFHTLSLILHQWSKALLD